MNKTLVVDIGGTHVKLLIDGEEQRQFDSGPEMGPEDFATPLKEKTRDWKFDTISIGFPSVVRGGKIVKEPKHLGPGWAGFDFDAALGKPVRVINDAAMQALGSYRGGRMLFLGLGTGLGSALIIDGALEPMELAHLPYKHGRTFEEYVGIRGFKRLGKARWRKCVLDVVERLRAALNAEDVVVGGGNARKLRTPPPGSRLGDNDNAFLGGFRLWNGVPTRAARRG